MARMTPREAAAVNVLFGYLAGRADDLPREVVLGLEKLASRGHNRLQSGVTKAPSGSIGLGFRASAVSTGRLRISWSAEQIGPAIGMTPRVLAASVRSQRHGQSPV